MGVEIRECQPNASRFGRMSFAMNMDERIHIMKEYGATFFEDVTQVKELDSISE